MRRVSEHKNPSAVWVVFTGQTDLPWLKILKPGFRHCYVLMNDGERWLSIDPLSHYMDVTVHHTLPPSFDLPLWLEERGHKVVKAPTARIKKEAPWMFFTCVEAVKRVLGLHERFIFTPWQLYKHLTKTRSAPHFNFFYQGEPAWEA
jgi:hypothetical protein